MDGAFFPQPDFQVPKKKVRQHARLYVMMPAHILSDFIVVHAQLCLGLLKTLLNRPTQAAKPDKGFEPDAGRCIADKVAVFWIVTDGSANQ